MYSASKINFSQFLPCMGFCRTFAWSFLCRKLSGHQAVNPWETRVSVATLVMKETIKRGKNFLPLGWLTPEIELDYLPGRTPLQPCSRGQRGKRDQTSAEILCLPWPYTIQEDQGVDWTKLLPERSHFFVETDSVFCVYVPQFPRLQNKKYLPLTQWYKDLSNSRKYRRQGPSLCVGGRVSQLMFLLLVVRLSLAPVLSWCQLSQEIPMARRRLERARIFSFPCTSICFPLDLIIILCICYISMVLSHKFVPKFFLNMLQCGKYFYQFYFLEDITERTFWFFKMDLWPWPVFLSG